MNSLAMSELLDYVRENDVKFIRLAFCDLLGVQKNIAVMPGALFRVMERGVEFDVRRAIGCPDAFSGEKLFLRPDPATLATLLWRPQHGRVIRLFCDFIREDGAPFEGDARTVLREALRKSADAGGCKIGWQCGFSLFLPDERGQPTPVPHDYAGYCDVSPLDRGENVRREVCLTLEEMGIFPSGSYHAGGPGQHCIEIAPAEPLAAADQFMTFKWVVKTIASRNGLFASFLPKPLAAWPENALLLRVTPPHQAEHFAKRVRGRISDMEMFLRSTTNSYRRESREAVAVRDGRELEISLADSACNPYLAIALLLAAGSGGEECKDAMEPAQSLAEAMHRARDSGWLKEQVGETLLAACLKMQEERWEGYRRAEDKDAFERAQYFPVV